MQMAKLLTLTALTKINHTPLNMQDIYIELYYGKYVTIDLHGKTIAEAQAELLHAINSIDANLSLLVVHGYHSGISLKNFVRENFKHPLIESKVNIDAGRTLIKLKR